MKLWPSLGVGLGAPAVGTVVGRWTLPNNGPCTLDYGLVATWLVALATIALVGVGANASLWAKNAANSAFATLRMEYDPVLVLGWAPPFQNPDSLRRIEIIDGNLLVLPAVSLPPNGTGYVTIRNIGRVATVNIKGTLIVQDIASTQSTESAVYSEGLAPGGVFSVGIHNAAPSVYTVDFVGVTFAAATGSSSAKVHRSDALPLTLG